MRADALRPPHATANPVRVLKYLTLQWYFLNSCEIPSNSLKEFAYTYYKLTITIPLVRSDIRYLVKVFEDDM